MRRYPGVLFVRGVLYHLLHGWYLWIPALICLILGLIRWTVAFPFAGGFAAVWILNAFQQEREVARNYEREDADPEFVAAVDREFKKRFEPED